MAHAKKRSLLPVGIHLTPEAVSLVQFEQTGSGLTVVAKASCSFTSPQDTVTRLMAAEDPAAQQGGQSDVRAALRFVQQELGWDGFKGKDVVINLAANDVYVQHIRVPPMQADDLEASLAYELGDKLPFPVQDAVVRHIVAGSVAENNETKEDVLVLAARRSAVQARLSTVAKANWSVVGVGVEPCCMCYGYAYASEHAEPSQSGPPCLMVVYLGWEQSYVAVLRGQETTFVKPVDYGLDHLVQAVASAREQPLEDAAQLVTTWRETPTAGSIDEAVATYNRCRTSTGRLTDEIQSCMRYYASLARGAQVDRLSFVGHGARDKALVRVLSASLSVPCEVGDPIGVATGDTDPEAAEPEMAVAVGLSLFGAN